MPKHDDPVAAAIKATEPASSRLKVAKLLEGWRAAGLTEQADRIEELLRSPLAEFSHPRMAAIIRHVEPSSECSEKAVKAWRDRQLEGRA